MPVTNDRKPSDKKPSDKKRPDKKPSGNNPTNKPQPQSSEPDNKANEPTGEKTGRQTDNPTQTQNERDRDEYIPKDKTKNRTKRFGGEQGVPSNPHGGITPNKDSGNKKMAPQAGRSPPSLVPKKGKFTDYGGTSVSKLDQINAGKSAFETAITKGGYTKEYQNPQTGNGWLTKEANGLKYDQNLDVLPNGSVNNSTTTWNAEGSLIGEERSTIPPSASSGSGPIPLEPSPNQNPEKLELPQPFLGNSERTLPTPSQDQLDGPSPFSKQPSSVVTTGNFTDYGSKPLSERDQSDAIDGAFNKAVKQGNFTESYRDPKTGDGWLTKNGDGVLYHQILNGKPDGSVNNSTATLDAEGNKILSRELSTIPPPASTGSGSIFAGSHSESEPG